MELGVGAIDTSSPLWILHQSLVTMNRVTYSIPQAHTEISTGPHRKLHYIGTPIADKNGKRIWGKKNEHE